MIYRTAPIGLAVFDRDLRFVRINERLAEINGASVEAHIGRTVREMVPSLTDQAEAVVQRVLDTGQPLRDVEIIGETPAQPGVIRTWVEHWFPVHDQHQTITGVGVVVEEVTEQRRAETVLRESEARFRNMADHAPVMIWVTNPEGYCTYLNREWFRVTGQTEDDALGFGWLDATHPDDRASAEATFLAANSKHETFRIEYRLRRHDGAYRWAIDAAAPRFGSDGTFLGYIGSVVDISDHKAAEDELQHVADTLREVDERKDEFLAMLAHELRNPLAPLRNTLKLLEREALSVRGQHALLMGNRQLTQLGRLVDDLLDVSRITRGTIELRPEWVNIGTVIHHGIDAFADECERRGHQVHVALPSQPVRIRADEVRISQIIENLLHNACKFTPDKGEIRVEVASDPDVVEIRVIDSGIGIDPAKQPFVFGLFNQIDASIERSQGGLGIGLALVKRLAELHGGRVSVQSKGPDKGSTFTVTLPRNGLTGN